MASTTWWDDPATNWSDPGPHRLVQLLAYAYPRPDEVRKVAVPLGLVAPEPGVPAIEAWAAVLAAASTRGTVLDLAAAVLHDQDVARFHAPLRTLLGDRVGEVNARILLRHGLPPAPPEGPDAFVESIVAGGQVPGHHGELQAITSPGQGLANPRAHLQTMDDMLRRTAMVEVGGVPAGTGFLVGPDLVLTAAHVIERYVWPPEPLPTVRAVFDFEDAGRSPAETGTPVPVKEFVTASLPTQGEADGVTTADWDAPADRLDFALLRLARPAPDRDVTPRGYYRMAPEDYDFTGPRRYFIMQHPLGGFVQLSDFSGSPELSPGGTRIRYGGNTLAGSSGSAVVDFRGRLVGLHHYATSGRNQGVPISVIARHLLGGPFAGLLADSTASRAGSVVVSVDPFAVTAVLKRPFVDRVNLREKMRDMAEHRDGARTLVINGASSRSGVSYSYQLASHVSDQAVLCPSLQDAAPEGIQAVRIDLRAYLKMGVERARTEIGLRLLLALGVVAAPTDTDAQIARETLTLVATLEARLRASRVQWWIFFDSVDNVQAVKQGEVDELIHALIELADDVQVPLRVVVAGREAEAFAAEHTAWAARDVAAGLTRGDVEGWLRRRADEEHRTIDETRLAQALTDLFPAGPLPEPQTLALGLPTALRRVLVP